MNVKTPLLAAIAFVACLTACERQEPTRTVEWFIENRQEMETALAACRSNPGELSATPNCINANKAKNKIAWSAKGRGIVLDENEKEDQP